MGILSIVLEYVLSAYLLILFIRLIFEWVQVSNRAWRPKGALAALAEVVYATTDPPIKLARKFIPNVRLGPVAIDMSFMVVMFSVYILKALI